jgi:biofilm protein TabA
VIYDDLTQAARYVGVHPGFARAFDLIRSFDPSMDDGDHRIDDACFLRVQTYASRPISECRWESHLGHIDVQYIHSGLELIKYAPIRSLLDATPYDPASDVINYADARGGESSVRLAAGQFAIFFPHDGHRPGIRAGSGADRVRKVVVKVRV